MHTRLGIIKTVLVMRGAGADGVWLMARGKWLVAYERRGAYGVWVMVNGTWLVA